VIFIAAETLLGTAIESVMEDTLLQPVVILLPDKIWTTSGFLADEVCRPGVHYPTVACHYIARTTTLLNLNLGHYAIGIH
jgi:hypothetical protein